VVGQQEQRPKRSETLVGCEDDDAEGHPSVWLVRFEVDFVLPCSLTFTTPLPQPQPQRPALATARTKVKLISIVSDRQEMTPYDEVAMVNVWPR